MLSKTMKKEAEVPLDQLPVPVGEAVEKSDKVLLVVQIAFDGFELSVRKLESGEELGEPKTKIPKIGYDYDYTKLAARVKEIHSKYNSSDTVLILSEKFIWYGAIVQTLDASRERVVDERSGVREYMFIAPCLLSLEGVKSGVAE
jgi:hypothetical protein